MNEMNDLEMQLRSWAPRRPSAKLRKRIFSANRTTGITQVHPALLIAHHVSLIAHWLKPASFRWLAPATAALFLTCVLLNQRSAPMASHATTPRNVVLSSNQSTPAYLPGSFERGQNGVPSDTFESTNGSGSTSSISSLSESKGRN